MARVRLPVGRQRIGANVSATEARFTRGVRAQMDAIIQNMKRIIDSIEVTSPAALEYAVKPIYDTSQELVPVDTGVLKASGFIEVASSSPKGTTVVVGYARAGRPFYAAIVHERLDVFHSPPTQAKFLEEAANRHMDEIPERYADYIRDVTGIT